MAVVDYKEIRQPKGSIDEQGYRTYSREFYVYSDDKDDGPNTIAEGVPIPLYALYSYGNDVDVFAYCKSQEAEVITRTEDGKYQWRYVIQYDSKPFAFGDAAPTTLNPETGTPEPPANQDPDERPWQIKGTGVTQQKALTKDKSDDEVPVVNSAHMPFKDGLEVEESTPSFSVTLYKAIGDWSPSTANEYRNTVNDSTFLGFSAGQLRCTKYDWQSMFEKGNWFWQLDLEFQVKEPDWDIDVLDAGTHEYEPGEEGSEDSPENWKPIIDKRTSKPVSEPVPLDGEGKVLTGLGNLDTELVYLKFRGYEWKDWTNIV